MVTCPPNLATQSTSVTFTGTPQDALRRSLTTYPNPWLPPTKPIYSINWHSNTVASGEAKACSPAVLMGVGVASTELGRDGVPSLLEYPCAPKQEHFIKV